MIRRLINNQSKTITGAALVLGAASFVSKIIAIFRDRIFASQFGAGDALDAYYAAFRIPDLVYNLLIIGALSAGFIPVFTKLLVKDKNEAWRVTSSIINILGILLVIICGLLFIFTPQLMQLIVPGFSGEKLATTILLTRIMFVSPILLGLSGIVSGVLQSFKSFFIYSLTPIMYNLGIIIGAIFFVPLWGIKGLAIGVILGACLHLLIQIPTLIGHGFRYHFILNLKNTHVREIGWLMIPRTLGLAAQQINWLVITILASTLAAGSLTVFNFANNLQYFPVGIIGISFALAAFPTMSKLVAENRTDEMTKQLISATKQILFFIVPLTIIFLLLRAQIVRVVLGSGKFDWDATILTMNTMAFFSVSLFAQCLIPLLARAFYALHNTWLPFVIGLASALINIGTAIYLKDIMGVLGLALAFSIAMTIQVALLWFMLRTKLKNLKSAPVVNSLYKICLAGVAMIIVIQTLKDHTPNFINMEKFWGVLSQSAITGIIGLLVYGGICYLLKLEEMHHLQKSMERKWLKLANIQGEVGEADEI